MVKGVIWGLVRSFVVGKFFVNKSLNILSYVIILLIFKRVFFDVNEK